MKIALQITTSTLGDMVIEEADDKTTTNPDDQKAIVVELLIQAISKVTAAYKIPQSMLDLGDEEYQNAHARKTSQDKEPRYSSAEANRIMLEAENNEKEHCCNDCVVCGKEEPESDDEEGMVITEEELEVVQNILTLMRGQKKNV